MVTLESLDWRRQYNHPVENVSSRQNAVVRRFRELAQKRLGSAVLLDGAHLLEEALAAGVELEVVAFTADAADGRLAPLLDRCATSAGRVLTVSGHVMDAISPVKQPSGVVAIASLASAPLERALAAGAPPLVLVLDAIQDPGNVGAIIRAAEACGASAVIAGPGTADPLGWKALRGSMGSAFRLPIALVEDLAAALVTVRDAKLRVFATVPRGGTPLRRADLTQPAAIIVGAEGPGLDASVIAGADEELTIEMRPPVESLNVGVAAALIVYEAARQRSDVAV